jgi:hypothetical protein
MEFKFLYIIDDKSDHQGIGNGPEKYLIPGKKQIHPSSCSQEKNHSCTHFRDEIGRREFLPTARFSSLFQVTSDRDKFMPIKWLTGMITQ